MRFEFWSEEHNRRNSSAKPYENDMKTYKRPPGRGKRPLGGKEGEEEPGAVEERERANQHVGDPHHHFKSRDQPPGNRRGLEFYPGHSWVVRQLAVE